MTETISMAIIFFLIIVPMCKVFMKAEKPAWAALIPFYNVFVMIEIVKKPVTAIFLLFIPFVNIYYGIVLMNEIGKAFGKGPGFGVGLFFLPFVYWPILAFGNARYTEPRYPGELV